MRRILLVLLMLVWAVSVCAQTPSSNSATTDLEARITKIENDLARLKEAYDALLQQDHNDIVTFKDDVKRSTTSATQDLKGRQEAFEKSHTLGEVPIGTILPYMGDLSKLPDNWRVCDGKTLNDASSPYNNQPLPDLQRKFVRGADMPSSAFSNKDRAALRQTGGQDYIAAHGHYFSGEDNNVYFGVNSINGYVTGYNPTTAADGLEFDGSRIELTVEDPHSNTSPKPGHGHSGGHAAISGNTVLGGEHDNRPAFVSLYYIVRVH